jgi:hypothetical protein
MESRIKNKLDELKTKSRRQDTLEVSDALHVRLLKNYDKRNHHPRF